MILQTLLQCFGVSAPPPGRFDIAFAEATKC